MARNGKHRPSRPRIEIRQAAASPAEAAAIAAGIEAFLRDTAPVPSARPGERREGWGRRAFLEHARADPESSSAWGEGEPWGR